MSNVEVAVLGDIEDAPIPGEELYDVDAPGGADLYVIEGQAEPELDEAPIPEPVVEEISEELDEIADYSAVSFLLQRGHTDLDEIKDLSREFGINEQVLTGYLLQNSVDIEDLETEAVDEWEDPLDEPGPTTDSLQLFLNQAGKFKLLTADEEKALARRIERGDKQAKDLLINSNLRLVVSIARRYQRAGMPLLDLIQEGVIGVIRATEKFDWRKGYKFSTYGTWWIRQAVQRGVANKSKNIRIPVHVEERMQKVKRETNRFLVREGREPTPEELATLTKLPLNQVYEVLEAASTISLDAPIGENGEGRFSDIFADEHAADPAADAELELRRQALHDALDELSERERDILKSRFAIDGPPESLEAIGKRWNLTRERVRQVEGQAKLRLAEIMNRKADIFIPRGTRSSSGLPAATSYRHPSSARSALDAEPTPQSSEPPITDISEASPIAPKQEPEQSATSISRTEVTVTKNGDRQETLIISGFDPVILSTKALIRLTKHDIPMADQLLKVKRQAVLVSRPQ